MPRIDPEQQEVHFKIAYWGPGLSGKWTNLDHIRRSRPSGEMLHLVTVAKGPLWHIEKLDLPASFFISGALVVMELHARGGNSASPEAERHLLDGVDGIVFMIDSQRERLPNMVDAAHALRLELLVKGRALSSVPLVLQYNKRDLPNAVPLDELQDTFNPQQALPFFETVAPTGVGVFDTLKAVTKLVLTRYRREQKPA